MIFTYTANKTFAQIHQDRTRFLFVMGPVGSGKSSGCIWHLFLNALQQTPDPQDGVRRTKFAIIRSTYPVLKTTVVRSWIDWFKGYVKITYDVPIRGHIKLPHPDGLTTVDMELVFIALDREEEIQKLQSLELTGCHINEAAEIPEGVFQMLKSRINRYPGKNATTPFIICDYNAVDSEHWLYNLAENIQPSRHSFYKQPSALLMCDKADPERAATDASGNCFKVNPDADNLDNLDEAYYADMVDGADSDWVNVFVLNNYGQVRSGRPVYKEYQDSIHYLDKKIAPLRGVPLIIGMDCGLQPAAVFTQLSPEGKLLILDEIITDDCSLQKFCHDLLWPKIRNEYPTTNFYVVMDPAAVNRSQNDAKAAYEVVRDSGLPFRLARTNVPAIRREGVVYFLRKVNGLSVTQPCKYIRKGFISDYKFEKLRAQQSEMFKEKPEKNIYSHCHDALQYACLEHAGGRIRLRNRFETNTFEEKFTYPATAAGY